MLILKSWLLLCVDLASTTNIHPILGIACCLLDLLASFDSFEGGMVTSISRVLFRFVLVDLPDPSDLPAASLGLSRAAQPLLHSRASDVRASVGINVLLFESFLLSSLDFFVRIAPREESVGPLSHFFPVGHLAHPMDGR